MDLNAAFKTAFVICVIVNVFATGLRTTTTDLRYLVRRPGLLLRSLLAICIVTPLVAILLWRFVPMSLPVQIAIVVGALAPSLPLLPRKAASAGGSAAYTASLMFITTLLGIVTIPLGLALLEQLGHGQQRATPIPEGAIVRMLALSVIVPLLAGVLARKLAPKLAMRIAEPVQRLGAALLPGLILVVLLVAGGLLLRLSWVELLAMVGVPLVALGVGHLLGGPEPDDRTVLAIANAGRSPALAGLVASTFFPDAGATPVAIAYVVVASLLVLPYQRARKRQHDAVAREPEAPITLPIAEPIGSH